MGLEIARKKLPQLEINISAYFVEPVIFTHIEQNKKNMGPRPLWPQALLPTFPTEHQCMENPIPSSSNFFWLQIILPFCLNMRPANQLHPFNALWRDTLVQTSHHLFLEPSFEPLHLDCPFQQNVFFAFCPVAKLWSLLIHPPPRFSKVGFALACHLVCLLNFF